MLTWHMEVNAWSDIPNFRNQIICKEPKITSQIPVYTHARLFGFILLFFFCFNTGIILRLKIKICIKV